MLGSLLAMVSVVVRRPAALGVKVTLKVALLPAAMVAGKVKPLLTKSLASPPLVLMALTVRSTLPLLLRVKVWTTGLLPRLTLPKSVSLLLLGVVAPLGMLTPWPVTASWAMNACALATRLAALPPAVVKAPPT